jgi:PAS domain S-box-containing protein
MKLLSVYWVIMKKRPQTIFGFFIPLALVFFLGSLDCCAQQAFSAVTSGTITVVSDDNYPPYIFRDAEGKLQGILVDEWALWEKKTGVHITLIGMDWGKAQKFLIDGKADVIDTIFHTEERAALYDFTKPYATLEVPIFFNKDISGISDLTSLRGFTIGVKAGDACIDVLKKGGIATLYEYASYEEIVQAAADGKIKVYCMDKPPALYYLYKRNLESRYRHTDPLYIGQFHRAVKKGQQDLLNEVARGFSLITQREHEAIERKWMGTSLQAVPGYIRYGLYVALCAIIIAFVFLLWNAMLRKRVSAKTSQLQAALKKLGASEALLKATIENLPYDFFAIDMNGRYFMLNETAIRRWGDVIGKKPGEIIPNSPVRERWLENNRRAFNGETVKQQAEYVVNGEPHHFFEMVTPIRNNDRQIVGILGINFDLTEQKQIEEALRENMRKYRALIETTNTGFVILDKNGVVHDANAEYVRLTGHESLSEIVNKPVTEWTADAMKEKNSEAVRQCYAQGFVKNLEIDYVDKQGKITPIEVNARVVDTQNGPQILTLCRDITERKKMQDQLRQSQKMEAIGKLAGGVAHDFNNILSAIVGYAALTKMKLPGDNPYRENIEQILQAAERATTLTRSLLSFSRTKVLNSKLGNLNNIVKGAEHLLLRLVREDIEFTTTYTEHELIVLVDAAQIEQVLMNLITNARDAMPQGGSIAIRTGTEPIDTKFFETHGYGIAGDYALITVSDSGVGMDAATQARIFEPFFTTKEPGKGTGLGLSMAYGIVKQHNGYINVQSEPGKGSTFAVYLPLAKGSVIKEPREEESTPARGGSETILVAEDDATLRTLTSTILRNQGYTAIEAVDGEDAVAKYLANKDVVKLVLLDGIMPNKNGKEVCQEIRKMCPAIRTIFISGYSEEIFSKEGVVEPGTAILLKPLTPSDLLKKVREVLDT